MSCNLVAPNRATTLPSVPQPHPLPGTLADWRTALGAHYLRLGKTSRQRRFMAALPDRSIHSIAGRANPDFVLGIDSDGALVGVLEAFRRDDGHAEIGISIEDGHQGRGYGRALFLAGLVEADRIGVRTADLHFAAENRGIRALIRATGGHIMKCDPDCEARIDIACFLSD